MVSSDCTGSVGVCALRVAQLTTGGVPQAGSFGYYTNIPIQVKAGLTNDTQNEQIQRNGCGTIMNRVPPITTPKGSTFSVDLSKWERSLIKLLIGGTTFTTSGHIGAWRAPFIADGEPLPVCIEYWTKAWDSNSQAVSAISTPNASYHHFVLPYVRCAISDVTNDDAPAVYTITGEGSENNNITANGPWNDWPSWIAGGGGFTSSWGEYDDGTIPTSACGLQTVPTTS